MKENSQNTDKTEANFRDFCYLYGGDFSEIVNGKQRFKSGGESIEKKACFSKEN